MPRIVMKFGGTSVADLTRIQHVARLVKQQVDKSDEVAVIVSAMAGQTNTLVSFVDDLVTSSYGGDLEGACAVWQDEYDVIVSSGEQITSGLLAIALRGLGVNARSWQGWQLPLKTDNRHSQARIHEVCVEGLEASLKAGVVATIPGFQGIGENGRVTTLGRGGSDTSAVAIAIALKADRCDIYTDVDGVYTTDPRLVPTARKLEHITFEEMLELASQGAKVLQTRSVELAMQYNMPIRVLSSFKEETLSHRGTLVSKERQTMNNMESQNVSGIAFNRDAVQISVLALPDRPGVVAQICGLMAQHDINVDMIVQGKSRLQDKANLVFTVNRSDYEKVYETLCAQQKNIGFKELLTNHKVSKISIVGTGMKSHASVAHTMFESLAVRGINIEVIATSEIKISVLIEDQYMELAVRVLHEAFNLA